MISLTQRTVPDNTQHSQETDFHTSRGFRTQNSNKPTAVDPRFRPRGHWDRFIKYYTYLITYSITSYLSTCLITPWSRVLEKLTGSQLVKKFSAFYGNRRFITVFTSAAPVPTLSQINPGYGPSHSLKYHLNIILPSTPWSSRWSLSSRFPPPKPCTHLSFLPFLLHASPVSSFSVTII